MLILLLNLRQYIGWTIAITILISWLDKNEHNLIAGSEIHKESNKSSAGFEFSLNLFSLCDILTTLVS